MVLTEGFDLPSLSAVIMARPTKSGLLYTQCVGRGTRLWPDHPDKNLVVVDLTDNSRNHTIASLPTLVGLPADFDLKGKSATAVVEELEELQQAHPSAGISRARSMDEVNKIVEGFDLLKQTAAIDDEVKEFSQFTWTATPEGYALFLSNKGNRLTILPNLLGRYDVTANAGGVSLTLGSFTDKAEAFRVGDNYLATNHGDELVLYSHNARWRQDQASDKQKNLMRSVGIEFPDNITKGQAARLITDVLNRRPARRR
jgi:hypothetical protein